MALEIGGDGVCHRPNNLFLVSVVRIRPEVGVEKVAGFPDGEAELKPVAGGADSLGLDATVLQPASDGVRRLGHGPDVLFDLKDKRQDQTHRRGKGAMDSPAPWRDVDRSEGSRGCSRRKALVPS